ncbi:MAG TPA: hypothetical protein VH640_02020 [Bryobacteraceae bacterium]
MSTIQRAAEEFKVVKSKRTEKLERTQEAKAAAGPRTLCDAWLNNSQDAYVEANSGLTKEAWGVLRSKAPALAEKIAGTKEKKETPAIACGEPQAVALLLSTYGDFITDLGEIRVSTALDQATNKTKPPCPNCSTWLEVAPGELDQWGDRAYRIKPAYR